VNQRLNSLRVRLRQQTRAEIVRVAFDLFASRGYDKVPAESIAAAAGVSRATFFNYFPRKELILREIASARAERLKSILEDFAAFGGQSSFENIVKLVVKLAEENAHIGRKSKKLLLETFFNQASQGLMMAARERAVESITESVARIPRRRKLAARLVSETLFAVYIATMLEWLMREGASERWLLDAMRERLRLLVEGVK